MQEDTLIVRAVSRAASAILTAIETKVRVEAMASRSYILRDAPGAALRCMYRNCTVIRT